MTDEDLEDCDRAAKCVLTFMGDLVTARNAKEMAADVLALTAEVRRLRAENESLKAEIDLAGEPSLLNANIQLPEPTALPHLTDDPA